MAAYSAPFRMPAELRLDELLADLNDRTGLRWLAVDEPQEDGSSQLRFVVEPSGWTALLFGRGPGPVELEAIPEWFGPTYYFWQLMAALARQGGVRTDHSGRERALGLPRWIDRRWSEMSWWHKLVG